MNNFHLRLTGLTILTILFGSLFSSCDSDEDSTDLVGNWVELSDFEGVPRNSAVSFVIGERVFLGTGYDGDDRLNDFWEYNVEKNYWIQKAEFGGVARNGAVGFATDSKGYIGTGYDGSTELYDFWEYDPTSDTWTEIASFDTLGRYDAVAFSINNKGYVGTGYNDNYLKDFYKYDPTTDNWEQIVSMGGSKRTSAIAMVIDNKAYVGLGIDNGVYEDDFWEYDPTTGEWTEKREVANISDDDYDDDYSIIRTSAVAFSINGFGYIATGGQGSVGADVWEYDPVTDLWEEKTSLEATERIEAVAFAVGDRGYIATGRSSSYRFDDLWGFDPFDEQEDYD
jgi:N-acetylneuraminic acid mutarotase